MRRYREDTSPNNNEDFVHDMDRNGIYPEYDDSLEVLAKGLEGIDSDQLSQMIKSLMENPDVMDQVDMVKNLSGPLQFINMLQGPLQVLAQLNNLGGLRGLGNITGLLNGFSNQGYGQGYNQGNNSGYNQSYNQGYNQGYNNYNRGQNNYYNPQQLNRYNQRPNYQNTYNNRYPNQRYQQGRPNLLGSLIGGVPNILLRLFGNR